MKYLQIIEIATNKVEKEFDITGKSESYIDKLEMGVARQLNWDLYRIAFVEKTANNDFNLTPCSRKLSQC